MKIDICLVTSNENPAYYVFYPYIKEIWEKLLNVKCILVYIGDTLPTILEGYEESIIMFKPITGIHTAFIAQTIRLLYPCIMNEYKNGILISDVDAIPLNGPYFTNQIEKYADDTFISYSFDPKVDATKEQNMSYNVALSKVWRDIFKVSNIDDINRTLIQWYQEVKEYHFDTKYRSKCKGFHFDQQVFYKSLENWPLRKTHLISFDLSKRSRLHKITASNEKEVLEKIREGKYDDFIFLRPYQKHLSSKLKIKSLILSK